MDQKGKNAMKEAQGAWEKVVSEGAGKKEVKEYRQAVSRALNTETRRNETTR